MASLQAKSDAVRAAVSSTSTCTPATVVTLKELLLPEYEYAAPRAKPTARTTKVAATSGPKAKTKKAAGAARDELLCAREKTVLATHVINATLKSLAEAAKPPPPSTPCRRTEDLRRSASKRTLRRSISAPLSPLQPRTLNRVASSPNIATKNAKPMPPSQSTGCLATVECARVAFTCLRSVKGPLQEGQADFQLENGISALVGKLLALGMHDQALKELRILKRRLDGSPPAAATKNTKATVADTNSVAAGISDLLVFHNSIPGSSLPTITACQIQVLKLVAATKKPSHIEALLPALRETNPSSPINLLSRLAQLSGKEAPKAARQLAAVSSLLLSMVPSVSTSEDTVAIEPRLSPIPAVAFELQALAFRTQLKWWKLAGHEGSVDDEILSPFTRCIRAFIRRQTPDDKSAYRTIASAFEDMMRILRFQELQPTTSSKSPLASIFQSLGSAAHAARQYDEAHRWFQDLKSCLCPQTDSSVRICSVSARTLAAALKASEMGSGVEQLVREVTDGLDDSLSGTVTELNELLESLSAARRSVVGLLMDNLDPNSTSTRLSEEIGPLLKTFILQYPRFVRRWMGTPPAKDAGARQALQFDQRRQMVLQSINQVLDAALMVVKCGIQARSLEWQQTDDVLQHCTSLLAGVVDPVFSNAKTEKLGIYHVKISSLYFSEFLELRKMPNRSKAADKHLLQALSRSIDAVKERTAAEKDKAQLSTKLELFADLCKGAGRSDDAVRTLRSICTDMAVDGVLSDVATALMTQAPPLAWSTTEKASSLSRTLRSIAKLDRSWNDWTFFLPEAERAAVLEHLMHLSSNLSASFQPLRLHDPSLTALLRIYTLEKYPIRRLRVLLHLCYQNIGDEDAIDELTSHLNQAVQQLQKKDKAEDASLSHYVPHLQAYHAFMLVLAGADDAASTSLLTDSVSSWKTMTEACQTKEDLYAVIDNPEGLLDHLQSLNHLAGLRGESQLQLAISELSIRLAKNLADSAGSVRDSLVLNHSHLATQHVNIGRYAEAQKALGQTKALIEQNEGISLGVVADFYLSQAEYFAGIGSFEEAIKCLSKAHDICGDSYSTWAKSKSQATVLLSMASFLQSTVSLQKGDVQEALTNIKSSVRMLSHDWSKLEAASTNPNPSAETSMAEISMASIDVKSSQSRTSGPQFWSLASPLLRSLLHISSVYAHIGMFQETIYYAETAWKIAESTQSTLYKAQVSAWTGSVYVKAGRLDKALPIFENSKDQMPQDACSSRIRFARQLGEFYWEMGDEKSAHNYLKIAEDTVHLLSQTNEAAAAPKTEEPATKKRGTVAARTVRATRMTTAKATVAPRTTKRVLSSRAKPSPPPGVSKLPKDVYQSSLLTAVILSRTLGFIHQKDWASALSTLEQAKELPKLLGTLSQEQVITATSLIGQSMEQMISDPVFSVIQESTISFPAVCAGPEKVTSERSPASASPPRKGRGGASERRGAKGQGGPAFADALKQAQDLLMEAHTSAMSSADSSMVHRICTLLQSTIILLSATSAAKLRPAASSGLSTVAVDLGRNITWTREKNTLKVPTNASLNPRALPSSSRRSSLGLSSDLTKFRKTYVEMIPKSWSVISISLSENRHDLCITKLQAGHSPFILRLPLERANSRDADSEVFNFEHGREELLDIIKLANETSHSARDFAAKGERSAWWSEREALDSRLKELLETVETTWLGGFKGIFSQHKQRPDLLARFQKSFQQILDGSLPSRNRIRGKKTTKAQTVTLDPRILDLFIGLGDPAEPDCDYDEALNDLLYFVVDILQFHGERNAYDEIDFDAMVVETYDALRGYYNAAKSADREDGAHTVLVLDKALHAFPWESLPCMADLSVSRVPSLACLRQLIMEAKMPATEAAGDQRWGHYVSAKSGTYILNPSSDLKNTQAFFQPSFKTLKSWKGIVDQAPQEADFEQALSASEVVLYFGHGSGAQYIRGKTVRRLDRCRPATFLMGCSSAALTEAGEFECYGPVWNYMMAGCPAVVGTLWDVTDRDIDRFAGRAFEEWGLFPKNTFKDDDRRSRSTARGKNSQDEGGAASRSAHAGETAGTSLAEAVMRARSACKFKYLNAAAVVVYGIPVYINEGTADA